MKKLFTLFGFFATSVLFAQVSFKSRIVTPGFGSIYSIVQTSDGNYAGVGYLDEDIYLVKIDASGSLLAAKTIGTTGYDDGVSIIETSDNNLAVGGVLNDQMAIVKLDNSLNVLWSKTYPAGDNSYGYHIMQTPDAGYMLTGYINQSNKFAGCLVKTDGDGIVTFAKQFFDFGNSSINDVVSTADGNYALLGDASASGDGKDSSYLIKINSSGAVIWSKYLNTTTNSQYPASLIRSSDGGLVVAGSVYQTFPTNQDPYSFEQMLMTKFSSDGTLQWSKKMSPSSTSESYSYKVMEDKDGGYVFSGALSIFNNKLDFQNNNSFLVKLSQAGALVWTKTIDVSQTNFTDITDIIRTGSSGYAACGFTDNTDNPDEDLEDGIFYKFDGDFLTCGIAGSFGSVDDIGTVSDKSIVTNDLTITSSVIPVTEGAGGSIVNICSALPLQLLSFNATLQNKTVKLDWQTTNEVNYHYFAVERSTTGASFTELQRVDAKNNSGSVNTYTTTDLHPAFGTSYYRIKQVDNNGAATYSGVVPVTISASGTIVISPNPVRDNIMVLVQAATRSAISFQVSDMAGRIVTTQKTNIETGTNIISIPALSLPKGTYILKVINGDTTQSVKFVKQ